MKLESSLVGDNGGMPQVQMQLAASTIQLEELKKGKEEHEQVWCTKCRIEGHHKDEYPTFSQYLATRSTKSIVSKEDTVRYVRNGAITQLSVHYYISTRVCQRTCFAIFTNL
jgi:hypothetical protein